GEKRSMINEEAAGTSTASPSPTATRAAKKLQTSTARPQAIVAADRSETPPTMKFRRLIESANRPHGKPARANMMANPAPWSRPTSKSVKVNSALIGSTTRLMVSRSANEIIRATQRTVTAYQPAAVEGASSACALSEVAGSFMAMARPPTKAKFHES